LIIHFYASRVSSIFSQSWFEFQFYFYQYSSSTSCSKIFPYNCSCPFAPGNNEFESEVTLLYFLSGHRLQNKSSQATHFTRSSFLNELSHNEQLSSSDFYSSSWVSRANYSTSLLKIDIHPTYFYSSSSKGFYSLYLLTKLLISYVVNWLWLITFFFSKLSNSSLGLFSSGWF